MLQKLSAIAPLTTWGLVIGSALLLLLGFVALGHAKLVRQAYGEPYRGLVSPHTLETMLRWTVALLAGGVLLFGIALDWPIALLAALAAATGLPLLLEAIARMRGAGASEA